MSIDKLSHTSWKCKYHIVFAPKYRRQVIYNQIKKDIGRILRQLCELKKVEILEAEACPDHIHMLVSIPPNLSVSQFVGYLKGKSSLMIFDRHANLKYKYGNRHFWCRGYYVNTAGADTHAIAAYKQSCINLYCNIEKVWYVICNSNRRGTDEDNSYSNNGPGTSKVAGIAPKVRRLPQ